VIPIAKLRQQLQSKFKSAFTYLGLGLLTLLLVTGFDPAIATRSLPNRALPDLVVSDRGQIQATPLEPPTLETLTDRGKIKYEAGQFSEALSLWQQALLAYQDAEDGVQTALVQAYLSLAYQALGEWDAAQAAIEQSQNTLQTLEQKPPGLVAKIFNILGSLQLAIGQTEAALSTWQQAEVVYRQAGDRVGAIGSQINQSQALQTIGSYLRSRKILEQINSELSTAPDDLLKSDSLRSLGGALQVIGDLQRARETLEQSLDIAQTFDDRDRIGEILFSLGNTARNQKDSAAAWYYYQQATVFLTLPLDRVELLLNQVSIAIEAQQYDAADALAPDINALLDDLPPSRSSIYARVNWADSQMKLGQDGDESEPIQHERSIAELLARSIQEADRLGDRRAQSYALLKLGRLYELGQHRPEARDVTEQALVLAQAINADDLTYRAAWQLGRLLADDQQRSQAIAYYGEAVNSLQSLRRDLASVNADLQFSFRDRVEPVYRQLVGLLLDDRASSDDLKQAREVLEQLQLAELDNFFQENCLKSTSISIDQIDPHAAVLYPMILPDRIEVILSLPGQPVRHYSTALPQSQIEAVVSDYFQSLHPAYSSQKRLALSQQIYDWLIRPAEVELAIHDVKTLVFVLDSALRSLPMSSLYDGKQYLVQKYAVALSPGLQLLTGRSLEQTQLKTLVGGLTEARQGFSALPAVLEEVSQIEKEMNPRVFLDQEFTSQRLENQLKQSEYNTIHLATHAQFSSSADDTFLLTWDGRIKVKEFGDLLQIRQQNNAETIELLVLSACQTAEGDRQASLGLAGLAVRSGARSTVATLWAVRDESTALFMSEFYKQLSSDSPTTRAEALRQAQLTVLANPNYNHPFFWSPFVLVGHWL
jgi:CHAT domain-containing protein